MLPFENSDDNPEAEYLSDGITESIINNLSQLSKLSVRSFSSVVHYKNKDVSPQTAGRELNVRAVLTGRLVRRGRDGEAGCVVGRAPDARGQGVARRHRGE